MTMNATPSCLSQSCGTCRAHSLNAAVCYSSVSNCFLRQFVKQWVLLREAITRLGSIPGRPTRLKPALRK